MIIRYIFALFFAFSCLHPAIAQERYKFAFVTHGGPGNPFWNVVIKGMEDAARRYDVDVQWLSNPTFSIADMPNFLDDAIANKVNGIGITCPDPEAIRESVERAHAAGIPIIVLNTADPNAGEDNALPTQFYVGASEYLGGQSNAKAILAEAEKRRDSGSTCGMSHPGTRAQWSRSAICRIFRVFSRKKALSLMA